MFKEKMVTTAIPERVFALCKIVEKGSIYSSELKNKMEPEFLGNGSVYFNDYKNAAETVLWSIKWVSVHIKKLFPELCVGCNGDCNRTNRKLYKN